MNLRLCARRQRLHRLGSVGDAGQLPLPQCLSVFRKHVWRVIADLGEPQGTDRHERHHAALRHFSLAERPFFASQRSLFFVALNTEHRHGVP